MKSRIILLILVSLICVNCSKKKYAGSLFLKIDNKTINIDGANLKTTLDTIVNGKHVTIRKENILNKDEQKLVALSIENSLKKKNSFSVRTRSCFAGYEFHITLIQNLDTLDINHESVSEWTKIYPEFKEIHSVINKRISLPE